MIILISEVLMSERATCRKRKLGVSDCLLWNRLRHGGRAVDREVTCLC